MLCEHAYGWKIDLKTMKGWDSPFHDGHDLWGETGKGVAEKEREDGIMAPKGKRVE